MTGTVAVSRCEVYGWHRGCQQVYGGQLALWLSAGVKWTAGTVAVSRCKVDSWHRGCQQV